MKSLLGIEIRQLGQLLRDRGLISNEDLKSALSLQQERHEKLGRILIDLGFVAERDIVSTLSEQLQIPLFTGEYPAVPVAASALPARFLRNFRILPVHLEGNLLSLVMADPLDTETQSAVRLRTGYTLQVFLATESVIAAELERLYGGDESAEGPIDNDQHVPPRFFSWRTDEQLLGFATACFDVVDFHSVDPDRDYRFQSLTLRRPDND